MDLMPNSGSRPYVIFAFLFFAVPLVLGPSMNAYLFALPPSRGFINSGNCSYKPSPSGPYTYKTCCWQDNSKGTIFTVPTYSCQRCKTSVGIIISCEQPEIQFRGGTIEPPSGGVLERARLFSARQNHHSKFRWYIQFNTSYGIKLFQRITR